jgi:hypothetical protein
VESPIASHEPRPRGPPDGLGPLGHEVAQAARRDPPFALQNLANSRRHSGCKAGGVARSLTLFASLIATAAGCVACGDPGAPLGGPFGGTTGYTAPDSGTAPDVDVPDAPRGDSSHGDAPTWTQIYDRYLAAGTVGNCGGCHSFLGTAGEAYDSLSSSGQIHGTSSPIVSHGDSDMSWFGGFMPLGGPSSDSAAESEMNAWVAAGALQN